MSFLCDGPVLSADPAARVRPGGTDEAVGVVIATDGHAKTFTGYEVDPSGKVTRYTGAISTDRQTVRVDTSSAGAEIECAVDRPGTADDPLHGGQGWSAELVIPTGVGSHADECRGPTPDEVWRINLYRAGSKMSGAAIWSDSGASVPGLGLPDGLGSVRFSGELVRQPCKCAQGASQLLK